jgi:hypothetical protein
MYYEILTIERGNIMGFGRPQIYTKEFIENEADEILEWVQKDSSIFLGDFAFSRKYSTARMLEWTKCNEIFSATMQSVKDKLASKVRQRICDPNSTYPERLAMRDLSNYDYLLKYSERDDLEFSSKLKEKEAKAQAVQPQEYIAMSLELAETKKALQEALEASRKGGSE